MTLNRSYLFWWLWTGHIYFPNFEYVIFILLTLNRSKKTNSKTPVGEKGYLCIFFGLDHCLMSAALHPSFSEPCLHWLWALPWHLAFFVFECIGIQFFNSLTCDLRDAMPRQRSLTLIPREAEDFPRGDNHSKHVPLPTYLAWL